MKRIFITSLLYFSLFSINAQNSSSDNDNSIKKLKELLEQKRFQSENQKNDDNFLALNTERSPLFLYKTDKGNVYSHPLDGMRFLVPEFNSTMPVAKSPQKIYIPNPLLPGNMPELNLPGPFNNKAKK